MKVVTGHQPVYLPWLGLLSPAAWRYEPAAFGVNLTPAAETSTGAAQ